MRVGTRIPVLTGSPGPTDGAVSYQYIDVGVNLDVTASTLGATTIRLKTNVDISSVIAPPTTPGAARQPGATVRQTKDQLTTVIPLDKPVILTTQDDPSYNTSMQVQVTAHIVK
jgi:type II secretory pathway component GspD/PulD (secretin)